MFDPLLTLLAAKAKAVGLVAGTALVTTALVGGGAVAMTAVSHDGTVQEGTVAEEVVPSADLTTTDALVASATPTVGIEEPDEDADEDANKVRPPLPADFTCDDTKNHGQNVSAYAKSLPKGPGRGAKISAVAQSDCGKTAGQDEQVEAAEVEETEEPEAAKAEKPAKAERNGKGKGKPAGAGRPEGKGKPAGKGGGKG